MPMTRNCPITDLQVLTADVVSITMEAGDLAEQTKAGQFVNIKCGEGLLLRRPISVCDVNGTQLTVVFQVKGEGTQWLSRCQVGEELDVLGHPRW